MLKLTSAVICLTASLIAESAEAQTNYPPVNARWNLPNQGNSAPKPVLINYALPPNCDESTFRAIDVWNATGSYFTFEFDNWTEARNTTGSGSYSGASIIIEDATITSGAIMVTKRVFTYWTSIPELVDADIEVNGNLVWYATDPAGEGEFRCEFNPLAGKFDYQSVMGHELGHAGGLGHSQTGPTPQRPCQLFYAFSRGEARRVLCAGEAAQWRNMYDYQVNPYVRN